MKLLALTGKQDHRYNQRRVADYANAMEARGWSVTTEPAEVEVRLFLDQLQYISSADVVLLHCRLPDEWKLRLLRKAARVLILDIDRAVFCHSINSARPARSPRRRVRFRAVASAADAVFCGNLALCEQALSLADSARVYHLPTFLQVDTYRAASHAHTGSETRLLWVGAPNTIRTLTQAKNQLQAACNQVGGTRLRVMCEKHTTPKAVPVQMIPWSVQSEIAELAAADIAVHWLPDHPWSYGDCGFTVLRYMAAGLPVVANPIGIHRQLISHGETGLLATSPGEWAEAIKLLAASPELRQQMGRAARSFVAEQFSTQSCAARFAEVCESLYEARQLRQCA